MPILTRLLKLSLICIAFLSSIGCTLQQKPLEDPSPEVSMEKYELARITLPRMIRFMNYKKTLGKPLEGSPNVEVTKQGLLSRECGVCAIHSVGKYFKTEWEYEDIKQRVLKTHKQGTSVIAIKDWFAEKGYKNVDLFFGKRQIADLENELNAEKLIIALIYSFRDGKGPNHFVIVSHFNETHFTIVDSRIGSYSVEKDKFCSKMILLRGTWLAVKP